MALNYGEKLRLTIDREGITPFIGVHDTFAASIAGRYFSGIFISGFSFAASYYGLPDIGFIAWSDIVSFVQRVRTILPEHHIIVDIDDGYCDPEVACHVVTLLENIGASGVILEDQQRPRKCGHYNGKQLLGLDQYLEKLQKVIKTRSDLFVIARTDATQEDEIFERATAFARYGADSILVDGIRDFDLLPKLKKSTNLPLTLSQMAGGKTPRCTLQQLREAEVSLTVYSTPCLFAAQKGIDDAMQSLRDSDGLLPRPTDGSSGLVECTSLLQDNLQGRNKHGK